MLTLGRTILCQGFFVVSPQPSPQDFIKRMLKLLLDQNDKDRAYVKFDKDDQVALLANNQGGMSNMEMNAMVDECLAQLGTAGSPGKISILIKI